VAALPAAPVAFRGELALDQVTFGYRGDPPVLHGIDLRIGAREQVALVAASGGGKTTLLNLLVRFSDPTAGQVRLDGQDLRSLPLATLRRAVCLVAQEPFIFSGSLLDNLRYGSWDAPRAQIDEAVRLAGLEPFVRTLHAGLQADLREAGHNLSVGQKQRICLARAIIRDPLVLILDEATSALDSDTEVQILDQAAAWLRQRTVLLVAHRLSTVARFARIVVMVDGRVVDEGTAAHLRHRCAAFRQLFAEQLTAGADVPILQVAANAR
jgi:ATP-binding cassette subfamily B protein